jgi:hypothetical protein
MSRPRSWNASGERLTARPPQRTSLASPSYWKSPKLTFIGFGPTESSSLGLVIFYDGGGKRFCADRDEAGRSGHPGRMWDNEA